MADCKYPIDIKLSDPMTVNFATLIDCKNYAALAGKYVFDLGARSLSILEDCETMVFILEVDSRDLRERWGAGSKLGDFARARSLDGIIRLINSRRVSGK